MRSFAFDAAAFDLTDIGNLDFLVVVTFQYRIGDAIGVRVGSGFLIDVWQDALVTAAHVIALPPRAVPLQVELRFSGDRGSVSGLARSIAYLDESSGTTDVGVVRLPTNRPLEALGMHTGHIADGGAPAQIFGFVNGARKQIDVRVTPDPNTGLLAYDPADAGMNGMSGGPVRTASAVVGIHLGLVPGMTTNCAVPIDDGVLDHLQKAAAAAEGTS
ncbi:MAG TPA: hypothetical protein VK841_14020 [Polyangiaceae bacterium]|jgi:hypothetical protein|nr:hypothetical protein [Polyangiaceae bacterium]